MVLTVLGVNYQTAPIDIRERLVFDFEGATAAARWLVEEGITREAVLVSTCNRTELYCYGHESVSPLQLLIGRQGLDYALIKSYIYHYSNVIAVKHLMRVASGLDSMILGEGEVLGQVKKAYTSAARGGTIGKHLGRLFQTTFSVAKRVRTHTGIGVNSVSVAYVAARLSQHIFSDLGKTTALLVGAGDLIRLTAQHLFALGVRKIMIANRTEIHAQHLASQFGGEGFSLEKIPERLKDADIVITGTASAHPILKKGMVESALRERKRRPMFMVDLSVPRDIEPVIGELEDVYLYCIDDLKGIVEENRRFRRTAALQAEEIVKKAADDFMHWLEAQNSFKTLGVFRKKFEQMRDQLLQEGLHRLKLGDDPEAVIQRLAYTLTNRFLHEPTRRLRNAGLEGEERVLELIKDLFDDHEILHSK